MLKENARSIIAGFVGSLLVLAAMYWLIGVDQTVSKLSMANTGVLVFVFVGATCWIISWGLALRTVLGVLGSTISPLKSTAIFSGVLFANNVTPFGQAGGEPISGLLISRATDRRYETGLAAIASVDALNFIPSIVLAVCGMGYLFVTTTFVGDLRYAAGTVFALALLVPIGFYLGWQYRYRLEHATVAVITPIVRFIRHTLLRRKPLEEAAIERRIEGFFTAIERVGSTPRKLAFALGLSSLGWIAQAVCLWLSLFALDHAVSPSVVLIAVPLGAIAGVTPLPGGLGGVDLVLIGIISALVTINQPTIAAAVLIHRSAIYLFPTIVGGGITAAIASR
ncbi:lysylphosphatidylglycerol synthase transmembrane domain-containing protein [Halocatena salina]|uniref:Flippase-like domain-containing protein n=1 Tax=Halocatena salina TaxID=2934340 RepID=A0A8U0A0F9_9EURY|nr:lysylphosphatidylglycerol synthase transmembrane domain-containing protein [Halocatena salina]UPM42580.1 flippase-like domain-containing protein [Halocatena salina]